MGQEGPGGVPEQLVVRDHGETDEDAGRETHIDGENVDVVCGAPALAVSGFELQGFISSEIVRGKGLEGQASFEGVIGTARPPQYVFSNLRHILLAFLLDFLCWPVIEF